MAKKDRRRRAGKNKKNNPANASDMALRQSALRAVRKALARAEATVRSIDAALRGTLRTKRNPSNPKRRGRKARRG